MDKLFKEMLNSHLRVLILLACICSSCFKVPSIGPGDKDFSVYLAGDYYLHRFSSDQIEISPTEYDPSDTPIIPDTVIECGTDGVWIIAKRQDGRSSVSQSDGNQTVDYWILNVNTRKMMGRLTLEQFDEAKRKQGVPSSVEMTSIERLVPDRR